MKLDAATLKPLWVNTIVRNGGSIGDMFIHKIAVDSDDNLILSGGLINGGYASI